MNTRRRLPLTIAQGFALAGFLIGAAAQVLVGTGVIDAQHVMGGRYDSLTPELRAISFVSAIVLVCFGLLITWYGRLLHKGRRKVWLTAVCWAITLYMGVNTILNAASESKVEMFVFGILTLYTFLACLTVMSRRVKTEAQAVE